MPPSVMLRVGPIGRLGRRPLSHSRQGRWGGCGATPCHAQSRADQGVVAPPLSHTEPADQSVGVLPHVTHRAGPIMGGWVAPPCHPQSRADQGVGEIPLPCTEQGGSGSCNATLSHAQGRDNQGVEALHPVTFKAGPMGRLRLHPVTHRAGPMGGLGRHTLSHTEQGRSGVWGAPPYQAQSRADQGVGVPSSVMNRAGWIGRL
uniref:Uncharacterized protein n=1 Tax=Myotis myotis TaxID=51298 RepID=A0A7J7WHW0_MYOMY|nr:hypothetical protein mMyoMyo1_012179 [Myotis myotis]